MHQVRHVHIVSRVAGLLLGCFFVAAAGTLDALAEFAVLRPVKDATLIEDPAGALGNGSGPAFFAGRTSSTSGSIRRAVLAFDVAAAVPRGSTVTRVLLRLNLSSTNAGPVPVQLHRLLADWGEGPSASSGGGGAPSAQGDSTWIHRYYDNVFWTRPGGDFDPFPRALTLVDQPGPYSWGSTPEMAEDVQAWLDHPEASYGWLLAGDESGPTTVKRFDSREHPEEGSRPMLEIDYVPPCSPDPAGPGYWQRQCASQAEPGFSEWVLPCADRVLADLGMAGIDACDAVLANPPRSCPDRAARKLSVLVLNVCAGRLQTTCPAAPEHGDCVSASIGELLEEISGLIMAGDCRTASGCATIPD
ncbi:MAG: DNRLRE domain-containing protein [Acidobacteria bacterium]|nr:DNRLRE domain-containing protein [Acidobacteriota bacterium]